MAGIESKESSTGVRLLSAYKRGLVSIPENFVLPHGLFTCSQPCPEMVIEQPPVAAQPWIFRVQRNFRFRFSGSASIDTADAGDISVESAGMQLAAAANPAVLLGSWLALGFGGITMFNAARLSNTSALASKMPISFDTWEIDCNDILTADPSAQYFQVIEFLIANSVAGAPVATLIQWNFEVDAAQFTDYHFSKWE